MPRLSDIHAIVDKIAECDSSVRSAKYQIMTAKKRKRKLMEVLKKHNAYQSACARALGVTLEEQRDRTF